MTRQFLKGNEAVIRGALVGGATHFFGYPITPASEIAHAAAELFPRANRCFLQAEDEVNAINMIYGAASAGARTMTATSGPGLSLMAEGISYIAGAELPAVLVDVQRAGPGLGNIWPEQSDYNAVVKGGGHGDYRNVVLAPCSAQEMCDFTASAFAIAERFRVLVCILTDAYVGQIMEAVTLPGDVQHADRKDWAVYADAASRGNLITSIMMSPAHLAFHNRHLQEKYATIAREITDWEEIETADARVLLVAYGISARVAYTAVQRLRAAGQAVGMLRPKTLFPFPSARLLELAPRLERIVAVELSSGQMAADVELAVKGQVEVACLGWMGGEVPSAEELVARLNRGGS